MEQFPAPLVGSSNKAPEAESVEDKLGRHIVQQILLPLTLQLEVKLYPDFLVRNLPLLDRGSFSTNFSPLPHAQQF